MASLRLHVQSMDCADEAALVRRALAGVRGVGSMDFDLVQGFVDVEYATGQTTEASILDAVRGTGLGVELRLEAEPHAHPDDHDHAHAPGPADTGFDRSTMFAALSGALFVAGWVIEGLASEHWFDTFVEHTHDPRATVAYGLSALAGVWPLLPRALAAVRHRRLDMHVLVCLTVVGAAALGEWSEGAAVACLFALAHRIEAWSIDRARAEIAALVGRGPSLVVEGLQQSYAAPVERWIERFAGVYTPVVTATALVVALAPPLVDGAWAVWLYRALVFLVLACPCALVISTPVTMVAALSSAARMGILVKGGAVLERAAEAEHTTRAGLAAAGVTVVTTRDAPLAALRADVVLTAPDEQTMARLVTHARRALRVVRQNVAIALLTKVAFPLSAPFGFAPLWMAVLADTGATIIVTLNGLRLLRSRFR